MKYLREKDIKRRNSFKKNESFYLSIKVLSYNQIFRKNLTYTKLLRNAQSNSSKVTIRNSCILTGRNKSVDRFSRLSRIKFREQASNGNIFGVNKASW